MNKSWGKDHLIYKGRKKLSSEQILGKVCAYVVVGAKKMLSEQILGKVSSYVQGAKKIAERTNSGQSMCLCNTRGEKKC